MKGRGYKNPNYYKYSYNRQYFKKIDSVKKAYYLGFILGDGHVARRKDGDLKSLEIGLQKRDREWLETFVLEIEGSQSQVKDILHHNQFWQSIVQIGSKEICLDLKKAGIPTVNKTSRAKYIDFDDFQKQMAFILG